MNKQLKDFTLEELKVLVYDLNTNLIKIENDMKILNNEILSRSQKTEEEEPVEEPEK